MSQHDPATSPDGDVRDSRAHEGRGVFITFEGVEGSGKSTQVARLAQRLALAGLNVRLVREPGGTQVGEAIRSVLLDPEHFGLDPKAELLLYEASRAQLVAEVIEPALAAGEVVICDRFYDSTTAYQGYARGLGLAEIGELNRVATGGLAPDLTIVLDVEPRSALERARSASGQPDRLELEDASFHERVRDGFLAIARAEPERVLVVPGEGGVEDVSERVAAAVRGSGVLRRVLPTP